MANHPNRSIRSRLERQLGVGLGGGHNATLAGNLENLGAPADAVEVAIRAPQPDRHSPLAFVRIAAEWVNAAHDARARNRRIDRLTQPVCSDMMSAVVAALKQPDGRAYDPAQVASDIMSSDRPALWAAAFVACDAAWTRTQKDQPSN